MTSPKTQEPSKAVVKAGDLAHDALAALQADANVEAKLHAFQLATVVQRARAIREAATQLANTQWGKGLSEVACASVARWALEAGIDPLRHIFLLGGHIYDNAELYLDKLAAMPTFLGSEVTLLAPLDRRDLTKLLKDGAIGDGQLKKLQEDQRALNAKRLRLQMEYGVPANINDFPDTAAAALVVLRFKDGTSEPGVNWAGSMGRTRRNTSDPSKGHSPMDPVGDQSPVKTAITRAYRKAAKKRVPVWFKTGQFGHFFDRAELAIADSRALAKAAVAVEPATVQDEDDPYAKPGDDGEQQPAGQPSAPGATVAPPAQESDAEEAAIRREEQQDLLRGQEK